MEVASWQFLRIKSICALNSNYNTVSRGSAPLPVLAFFLQTTRSPATSIWFLNIERGDLRLTEFGEHVVCVGVGYMVVIISTQIRKVRSVLDSAFALFPASYIPCIFPDVMSHVDCLAHIDIPKNELGT